MKRPRCTLGKKKWTRLNGQDKEGMPLETTVSCEKAPHVFIQAAI